MASISIKLNVTTIMYTDYDSKVDVYLYIIKQPP